MGTDPTSRRAFLARSLAETGALALGLGSSACRCTEGYAPPAPAGPAELEPGYVRLEREGKLERIERRLLKLYDRCAVCPRRCEKKRSWGEIGECRTTSKMRVASARPHRGEERPLVGRGGSGTIFFSYCNLLCCFCQNWEIAHRGDGDFVDEQRLAEVMLALQARGCHNINLVTPTHVVPGIVRALRIAARKGLRLPLVYNTGGYDSLEVIRLLDGVVDIYMPDFKFQDARIAARYLHKCKDYPRVAAAAIKEMHRQVGLLRVDESGVARRGLILRHLVMPQNLAGTDGFVKWVARELSPKTFVNLMDQYRPAHRAFRFPEIARRLTSDEWAQAAQWAIDAGLEHWRG
jgi:putative pyruvate formate lyase activating enzyme